MRRLGPISKRLFSVERWNISLIQLAMSIRMYLNHSYVIVCTSSQTARLLFYWIFIPLVQDELANFQRWWNNHRVRTQENKMMPSGHVPSFALEYPSTLNGVDCRIEVPKEAIARLREFLEEETNKSREEFFRWYPDDFAKAASSTWEAIGKPVIRLETAWDVFSQMMPLIS